MRNSYTGKAKIRALVVIALILILIIAAILIATRRNNHRNQNLLLASGTIEATEIDISAKVPGKIIRLTVQKGDSVTEGQLLAELDSDELRGQVEQARGALAAAKARLADLLRGTRSEQIRQARANLAQAQAAADGAAKVLAIAREAYTKSTQLKGQVEAAQAQYDAAKSAYDQAKAGLDLVEEGTRQERIDQAHANLESAGAALAKADEDFKRAQELKDTGAISRQQLDAARAQRDSARGAYNAAQALLAEAKTGARAKEKEQARAAVAQAEAMIEGARRALDTAKQLYSDRLAERQQLEVAEAQYQTSKRQVDAARAQLDLLVAGATKEAIEAARGQVTQTAGALQAAEATLAETIIRSPASGRVTLRSAEPGEMVTSGMPIVRIAHLERVRLNVYVPLPYLGKVKLGRKAGVTADTFPDKKYRGRVIRIAQEPEFTPKNVQTKEERVTLVFGVEIEVDNPEEELKPGMPADASIFLSGAR
jgi:multidrug resistance efflux pump